LLLADPRRAAHATARNNESAVVAAKPPEGS